MQTIGKAAAAAAAAAGGGDGGAAAAAAGGGGGGAAAAAVAAAASGAGGAADAAGGGGALVPDVESFPQHSYVAATTALPQLAMPLMNGSCVMCLSCTAPGTEGIGGLTCSWLTNMRGSCSYKASGGANQAAKRCVLGNV